MVTRASDFISLQFSDGTFGNLPTGTFRTYYRVSNGLDYTITTQDIRSVSVSIPYVSATGQVETLTLSLALATSVSNASAAETNESIKANTDKHFELNFDPPFFHIASRPETTNSKCSNIY